MIRGLYTSGWSMLADTKKMDVIANNLANVNTNGFKKDTVIGQSFPELLAQRIKDTNGDESIGNMSLGWDVSEVHTNFLQGQLINTGNSLDVAIKDGGKGFFSVGVVGKDGNIQEYYTRDGAFTLDASGRLVNKDGNLVLGQNGIITLNNDSFSITADGSIIQNNVLVDRLKLVTIENIDSLRKQGNNLLSGTDQTIVNAFDGSVVQGNLETSNVNIIKEMVDMISVTRSYEASQKALQAQDGTLEKAVNQVGSLR